ncbi:AFR602Wp [Eremothecium gossypii ATCC 10895]|uniref:AFR602Wp n=1 Tax=Eremothecium gossypii (strain ATCC 10895 / CBS 109.51 / FGSC 9923 / NRRL Y-1056) TaxID=284811 RepID=Q752H1_EREGS|nr:AFR602Wp [Eremothecium gossypii ATCC 10895]AAS53973.1 AFR602Wp [Eremothecium gossypii ATCC 10895]AEY98287.1 FAFR602Wp [Eremothecium gossypii FDAG1]
MQATTSASTDVDAYKKDITVRRRSQPCSSSSGSLKVMNTETKAMDTRSVLELKEKEEYGVYEAAGSTDRSISLSGASPVPEGSLVRPVLYCLSVAFCGIIFGWDLGTIGGISTMPSFQNTLGPRFNGDTGLHEFPGRLLGLLIGIFNIGCAIGGLTIARLGDIKGRKIAILTSLLVYAVGMFVQLGSGHFWYRYFIGRLIAGLAVGATMVLVPMFLSELAPVRIRGAMIVLYQVVICLGIALGSIVNYACKELVHDTLSNMTWKVPIFFQIGFTVLLSLALLITPESAEFLAMKGHLEKAKRSFAVMNGLSKDHPFVEERVASFVQVSMKSDDIEHSGDRWEFIRGNPRLGLRLFIGVTVMALQMLSGVNYFFYYGTTLFRFVGIEDAYVTSIIIGCVDLLGTFIGVYIVERLGRKICLLSGATGMFICMTVYACLGSFALKDDSNNKTVGAVMIFFTCVFVMFFAATSGPVSMVVMSEIFPIRTKVMSMAICTSVNWLVNFLIAFVTPDVTDAINYRFGFVFSGCLLFSIVFFIYLVPETKGLTHEQVDAIYEKTHD